MQISQAIEEKRVSGPGRLPYLNTHRSKDRKHFQPNGQVSRMSASMKTNDLVIAAV